MRRVVIAFLAAAATVILATVVAALIPAIPVRVALVLLFASILVCSWQYWKASAELPALQGKAASAVFRAIFVIVFGALTFGALFLIYVWTWVLMGNTP
jgi:hypothetical protein